MNVLIVEDDLNKLKEISKYLAELFPDTAMSEMKSYQSGLKCALEIN